MQKSKTYFEQIPVEIVKKIAKEDAPPDNDTNDGAISTIGINKLKPHRWPSLGQNGKSVYPWVHLCQLAVGKVKTDNSQDFCLTDGLIHIKVFIRSHAAAC